MSDQVLPTVTDATGDVRLAREAWKQYGHLDRILSEPRHGHGNFQDQILSDLWIAVRAAAGQTRTDATPANQEKKEDTTT